MDEKKFRELLGKLDFRAHVIGSLAGQCDTVDEEVESIRQEISSLVSDEDRKKVLAASSYAPDLASLKNPAYAACRLENTLGELRGVIDVLVVRIKCLLDDVKEIRG